MPNHFPSHTRKIAEIPHFFQSFLNITFTKGSQTAMISSPYHFNWLAFADSQDGYFICAPTAYLDSTTDLMVDICQIVSYFFLKP
jgi:hypothetical protein